MVRIRTTVIAVVATALASVTLGAPPAGATPPNIPVATAEKMFPRRNFNTSQAAIRIEPKIQSISVLILELCLSLEILRR